MKKIPCLVLGMITLGAVSEIAQANPAVNEQTQPTVALRPIPIVRESDVTTNMDAGVDKLATTTKWPVAELHPLTQSSSATDLVHQTASMAAEEAVFAEPKPLVTGNADLDQLLVEIRRIVAPILNLRPAGEKTENSPALVLRDHNSER
jgi:hypothetical protein